MMIGIDFGTTNSSVAVWRTSGAEMIETTDNMDFMPSVVAETEGGLITGRPALLQIGRNPEFTFRNVKRLLGHEFDEQEHGHFQLAEGPDGMVWWRGRNGLRSGPELVAEILKSLLHAAELRLGRKPTGAVIAVPVDFRAPQIAAIREAAQLAGLKKVELFEEPSCAALAFGVNRKKYSRVVVYDLGGGTFDVTVLKTKEGAFQPVAQSGTAQVGGSDFDQRLADFAVDGFFAKEGEDLRANALQMVQVTRAAEEAKKMLSNYDEAEIYDENILFAKTGLTSIREKITRSEFEELTEDLVVRTIASVNDALAQAGMTADDIDNVLMVGGQSRMPLIYDTLEAMFGAKKIVKDGPKPELAVAKGAAIRAAEMDGRLKPTMMQMLVSHSIGITRHGGVFYPVIRKGETFPLRRKVTIRAALEDQTDLGLVVSQGEAMYAAECTQVFRHALDVEPDARVSVAIEIDESGRLTVQVGGELVYGQMEEAA